MNIPQQEAHPMESVDCDREAWIKNAILTALRMAVAVNSHACVRADEGTRDCALEGIANGAAVEVIRILGRQPGFVNLRRPPRDPRYDHLIPHMTGVVPAQKPA